MPYDEFLIGINKLLKERFPGNYNYVNRLAQIIRVDPKTIRNKLSGRTQFTVKEILEISKDLDISFSNLLEISANEVKDTLDIYFRDFSGLDEYEKFADLSLGILDKAAKSKSAKYLIVTNTFPDVVYAKYPAIARFCYLKWLYFNLGTDGMLPFSEIILSEDNMDLHRRYQEALCRIDQSVYILNNDMTKFAVDDILFFYQLNYLSSSEGKEILDDCEALLLEVDEICKTGYLPENGKEVSIFYSNILLSDNFALLDSDDIKVGILYAYFLNPIITRTRATFDVLKKWFHSWLRSANIISMSGESNRIKFLSNQRREIERGKKITRYIPFR